MMLRVRFFFVFRSPDSTDAKFTMFVRVLKRSAGFSLGLQRVAKLTNFSHILVLLVLSIHPWKMIPLWTLEAVRFELQSRLGDEALQLLTLLAPQSRVGYKPF